MVLYNRLSKVCKYKYNLRRQKIILTLNATALMYSLRDASFKGRSTLK